MEGCGISESKTGVKSSRMMNPFLFPAGLMVAILHLHILDFITTPSYYSSIGEKGKNVSCLNLVSISISSFLFASYCLPLQTVLFSATCHRGEKAALLKVKYSWHNPDFLFSWDTAADCCNWTYIICSQVGRSDISTFLPPVIGELSALKSLANAFMPALTSPIPPFFTKLTGLEVLHSPKTELLRPQPQLLDWNIPPDLPHGDYSTLFLRVNRLWGEIPKSYANVDSYDLDLSYNKRASDALFLFGAANRRSSVCLSRNKLKFDLMRVILRFSIFSDDRISRLQIGRRNRVLHG
ncbi:Polygalacturonase inhibitor 2 [Ananas comosus]|uniref:Polygalacturonase inhibitor 2 n=1 Tax=Ananas comosus TaxID=4615 RepID=A0A199W4B9_ANACO|nr:Polygalacturonase inhibitor 2 [Ananas comosus]